MSIITTVQSKNYSTYNCECIGIIDYTKMIKNFSSSYLTKWSKKFAPKYFFGSFLEVNLSHYNHEDPDFSQYGRTALFVPSESSNKNWDCSFWLDKYPILGTKKRKLPIAISDAKIKRWQNAKGFDKNLFCPDYFLNAKCITDLQNELSNNNTAIKLNNSDFSYVQDLNTLRE